MMRHHEVSIGDFLQGGRDFAGAARAGGVITTALPCGPDGQTRVCVTNGIYLVRDGDVPLAVMLRPTDRGPRMELTVQIAAPSADLAKAALDEIRRLAADKSVFRGQLLSFGPEMLGPGWGSAPLSFLRRPRVDRSQVILPADVLDGIERQVLGVSRHSARLAASGQHLKRGILLYGAPGTGKTHTVSYLLSRLPDVTAIVISGLAPHFSTATSSKETPLLEQGS